MLDYWQLFIKYGNTASLKCQNYCIQIAVYHTEFSAMDFLNGAMTRVLLLTDRPSLKDVHVTSCIFFIINNNIKTADLWL